MTLDATPERELADCYGYAAAILAELNPKAACPGRLLPLLHMIRTQAAVEQRIDLNIEESPGLMRLGKKVAVE